MKNILIVTMVVFAIGYMFFVMKDKYENIKKVNNKIEQQNSK